LIENFLGNAWPLRVQGETYPRATS